MGAAGLTAGSLPMHEGGGMQLKLGKLPAQSERVKIRLADYVANVPLPPANFGHQNLIRDWGVLGNDNYGCCFWSGGAHEHMLLTAEGGKPAQFTTANVLSAYSGGAGFDPANPATTDLGTVAVDGMEYRKRVGIPDAAGNMHKIEAYARIALDPDAIAQAAWIMGAVGIGVQMPKSAMLQFNQGKPWDVPRVHSPIMGGHYIPVVARADGMLFVVTWGKLHPVTARFLARYCDEAYAIFTPEFFVNDKSPEGFDRPTLIADLNGMAA
jgi:hypothetical protein